MSLNDVYKGMMEEEKQEPEKVEASVEGKVEPKDYDLHIKNKKCQEKTWQKSLTPRCNVYRFLSLTDHIYHSDII
jgi:hypothetical protein